HLLLGALAAGDVEHHALPELRDALGVANEEGLVPDPDLVPVAVDQPVLDRERLAGGVRPLVLAQDAVPVRRMEQPDPEVPLALPHPRGIAEHRLDLWTDVKGGA